LENSFGFFGKLMAKKIRIGLVCYKDKAHRNDWEIVDLNFNLDKIIEVLGKH
jgi:hypothetical protein